MECGGRSSNAGEEGVPDSKGFMKKFRGNLVPVVLLFAGIVWLKYVAFPTEGFIDCIGPFFTALVLPLISHIALYKYETKRENAEMLKVQGRWARVCHLLGEGHSHEGVSIRAPSEVPIRGSKCWLSRGTSPSRRSVRAFTMCTYSHHPGVVDGASSGNHPHCGRPLRVENLCPPQKPCERLVDAGVMGVVQEMRKTHLLVTPTIRYIPREG